MAENERANKACKRCGDIYHQRLVKIYNNSTGKEEYECLDYLAELLAERLKLVSVVLPLHARELNRKILINKGDRL